MKHYNDFDTLALDVYENAKAKGFRTHQHSVPVSTCINNLVGEVVELWEAYRKQTLDLPCDKVTLPYGRQLTCREEEMADVSIRVLDLLTDEDLVPSSLLSERWDTYISLWRSHEMPFDDMIGVLLTVSLDFRRNPTTIASMLPIMFAYAEDNSLNYWECLSIKHAYNCDRPYKHGGKLC